MHGTSTVLVGQFCWAHLREDLMTVSKSLLHQVRWVERNDWKFLLLLTDEFSRYMGICMGIQPPSGVLQALGWKWLMMCSYTYKVMHTHTSHLCAHRASVCIHTHVHWRRHTYALCHVHAHACICLTYTHRHKKMVWREQSIKAQRTGFESPTSCLGHLPTWRWSHLRTFCLFTAS